MIFARVAASLLVLGSALVSAAPVSVSTVETQVQGVLVSLKSTTDSVLPQICTFLPSNLSAQ